jgi:hypothetical protein
MNRNLEKQNLNKEGNKYKIYVNVVDMKLYYLINIKINKIIYILIKFLLFFKKIN